MSNNHVSIQETHEIPSRGKIYGDMNVPSEFTLRAMTTLEEKMRLSGSGIDMIPKLIGMCLIDPKNIDVGELKMFDIQFLMYKLRTITYGPEYKTVVRCPNCGSIKEIVVNLDKIPVNYIDDDFTGTISIGPLPVSKDIIECRALSANDYKEIDREAKRIKTKFPEYVGDPEFILSYQYRIVKVNDKELPNSAIQKYVETMNMRDVRYLDSKYDERFGNIGLDTSMIETCSSCGGDINFQLSTGSDFFRPEY